MLVLGLAGGSLLGAQRSAPSSDRAAEARVLKYIREHTKPGQPLRITDLYNHVFTAPDDRKTLAKFYSAFFRILLFVAQYQQKFGRPPTLAAISQQFDLHTPGAAGVLLQVMESDPRVPHFLTRDPKTGEITHVDVARIENSPRFGQALTHQLGGWKGKPAPEFSLSGLDGAKADLQTLRGKTVLLYVWFTGCPPCMKETPALVDLQERFRGNGLVVIGANADNLLKLGYDDAVRRRYAREHGIQFPVVYWTHQSDAAYGGVSIFPTMFLVDSQGIIRGNWVGFTDEAALASALKATLSR